MMRIPVKCLMGVLLGGQHKDSGEIIILSPPTRDFHRFTRNVPKNAEEGKNGSTARKVLCTSLRQTLQVKFAKTNKIIETAILNLATLQYYNSVRFI